MSIKDIWNNLPTERKIFLSSFIAFVLAVFSGCPWIALFCMGGMMLSLKALDKPKKP